MQAAAEKLTLSMVLAQKPWYHSRLWGIQNVCRGSLTKTNDSEIINARLTNDSAGISGDTRTDSLRLIVDNEEEEVWVGDGVTVRKRK